MNGVVIPISAIFDGFCFRLYRCHNINGLVREPGWFPHKPYKNTFLSEVFQKLKFPNNPNIKKRETNSNGFEEVYEPRRAAGTYTKPYTDSETWTRE
jgi:hypothetical protein